LKRIIFLRMQNALFGGKCFSESIVYMEFRVRRVDGITALHSNGIVVESNGDR